MAPFVRRTLLGMVAVLAAALGFCVSSALSAPADDARVSAALTPAGGHIVVEASGIAPEVPLFYTAEIDQEVHYTADAMTTKATVLVHVLQGRPEVITLALSGDGNLREVSGDGVRDWAVRQGAGAETGQRFLDVRLVGTPVATSGKGKGLSPAPVYPTDVTLTIRSARRFGAGPVKVTALLVGVGDAVGGGGRVKVDAAPGVELRVTDATGLTPVDPAGPEGSEVDTYVLGRETPQLSVQLASRGGLAADVSFTGVSLNGHVDPGTHSVGFTWRGTAHVRSEGAHVRWLAGRAAPAGAVSGDGWHAELVRAGDAHVYDLVFERAGDVPVSLGFDAAISEEGDWRRVDFTMPEGAVVPLTLDGLSAKDVEFDPGAVVVPVVSAATGDNAAAWRGFLPADGHAVLGWRRTREAAGGALFFTSSEQTEVRVGAGLLREVSDVSLHVLQGSLGAARLRIDGPGEIVGVDGTNVTAWRVVPAANGETARVLEVSFSRPFEGRGDNAAHGPTLVVERATYGDRATSRYADVTALVTNLVQNGALEVLVDYRALRADPAPGVVKQLDISYSLDGVPGTASGVEGSNIRIGTPQKASDDHGVADASLTIRSQVALDAFPTQVEPLRLTPEGTVRHSGFVRVANNGAVRLDVTDVDGMLQLAPEQFPGPAAEYGVRQSFVYRFPAAQRSFNIRASQILPEVNVSQVALYTLGDTDRVLSADVELDIREAPLRDWTVLVPADFTVTAVQGGDVADYSVESAAQEGRRSLKVVFKGPIDGRHLVSLRLERNEAAAAGAWALPRLDFPGAKTVRGHVGVVATPGYRIASGALSGLVEVPLSFFPRQEAGLQQAYRLRDAGWSATMQVEALGQSVQADVFHLYALREGVVYGAVLINYFVVGAPASEWRIAVPAEAGNLDVTGQNVRRDWRRDGDALVVSLHQPVLGAATVLVTFEEPMSARGGVMHPGEVRPLGVQSERGYVQVVSPLQVKWQVHSATGGLLRLEPAELPAELRLLSSAPSLAVYQYTARPFNLELGVEWYEPGDTVDQVVDFARLSSQVSRDGQVVTEARYFVKTRGRKALHLELPNGVKLWEARVDHEIVNARTDGAATLIPLQARLNPNEPVEVALRLGQEADGGGSRVMLAAPRMGAPLALGEWVVNGDAGRLLVPHEITDGGLTPTRPVLTERGTEWISRRAPEATLAWLALVATTMVILRLAGGRGVWVGTVLGLSAVAGAGVLALYALNVRDVNHSTVTLAATMVPADGVARIELGNVPAWRALVSVWGVVAALAGIALLAVRRRVAMAAGLGEGSGLVSAVACISMALGVLAQRGGAVLFFVAGGLGVVGLLVGPTGRDAWRDWSDRRRRRREARRVAAEAAASGEGLGGAGAAGGVVGMLLALLAGLGALGFGTSSVRAAEPAAPAAAIRHVPGSVQTLTQRWHIHDGRLFAEVDVTVRGAPGDSLVLLRAPAVLTAWQGDGVRVTKVERDGAVSYNLVPEREGVFTGKASYELAVPDLSREITVPTGAAVVQRVEVQLDEEGWEFTSPQAVDVRPLDGLGAGHCGATLVFGPDAAAIVRCVPKRRDPSTEATRFIAEVATLYVPAPGVVNGYARVGVRPVQGRVDVVSVVVPEGFTVGDVRDGPVGSWRFDPEAHKLRITIEPAQSTAFGCTLELQRGAGALPFDLDLHPLRVEGASGEVGSLALAFGGDAQPEAVRAEALSGINTDDFPASLVPCGRDGKALAVLHRAWRAGSEGDGRVALRVAPVSPEIRAVSQQVLSLGDDRMVLAVDWRVSITRVGVFQLTVEVPATLEVEALTGPSLQSWTEAVGSDGVRMLTLHLNGRTVGDQDFSLSLAGPAPAARSGWAVPHVRLLDAARETGVLQIVPEPGLRVRASSRDGVTQLDPRASGNTKAGVLAFRLLQADWALQADLEALEPWVTVQALEEVTLREGQTRTRLATRYRVENAAVKYVRVHLPGLDAEQGRTVRATGSAVADCVPVPGTPQEWEVRFQHGIVGETDVTLEWQGEVERADGRESLASPVFTGARQTTLWVAVRGGGRLELSAVSPPRGWARADWSAVQSTLQDRADRSVPALCFHVAEPEGPLVVGVVRHDVADALKLRVTRGVFTTLFSPQGASLTDVQMHVEVAEKSTLRVRLPDGAQLFNTFVNGESVPIVREGGEYLFYVTPTSEQDRGATVRLAYSVPGGKDVRGVLRAPGLNVPLENVSWRVVLPPGYALAGYEGGLRLHQESAGGRFGIDDYLTVVGSRRDTEKQEATALLDRASSLLQRGEQQQAGELLSRAANYNSWDAATNEDARVQLRALKTQQAVLGLNTRRQRMYLDNKADAPAGNAALEQAASANPFLQGRSNFDPTQVDQLLQGNTADENTALRVIAGRIVDQQLAAEPAPTTIDVTVPQQGDVVTFERALQVDGEAGLTLRLMLQRQGGIRWWPMLGLLTVLGALCAAALSPMRRAAMS